LEPFRRAAGELLTRQVYVQDILKRGTWRAQSIAASTMQGIKKAMGLTV